MREPARSDHARVIATGPRQARRRPRRPGDLGLRPGPALEQSPVGRQTAPFGQRRHMPGATHHRDWSVALPGSMRDLDPHVGFARRLTGRERAGLGADRGHRVGDRGEDLPRCRILLDHVGPPGFAVIVAGRSCEHADRVAYDRVLIKTGCLLHDVAGLRGQPVRGRQVDKAQRSAVSHRPAGGLIFGGIVGEGKKAGIRWLFLGIDQQCNRWRHPRIREQRQQFRCIHRSFDQHRRGPQHIKRLDQPSRRARTVMTDAEQRDIAHRFRSIRSGKHNSLRTRAASSARSQDIRQARRGPAPDP
jgi:hypothetical protein